MKRLSFLLRWLAPGALVCASCGCGRSDSPSGGGSFGKPAPTVAKVYDGATVEEWTVRLSDPDPAARYLATAALASLDAAKDAKTTLVSLLEDAVPAVRFGALDALGRIADPDAAVVTAALALLEDSIDGIRRHAKAIATRWGTASLPALRRRILSKEERTRRDSLEVLATLAADGAPARAELGVLLRGDDLAAQDDAAQALAAMGAAGIPALVRALKDLRSDTAVLAASALARMGSEAAPAVPALAEAIQRKGPLRTAALDALVAVGEPARATLEAASRIDDAALSGAAAEALERLPKR